MPTGTEATVGVSIIEWGSWNGICCVHTGIRLGNCDVSMPLGEFGKARGFWKSGEKSARSQNFAFKRPPEQSDEVTENGGSDRPPAIPNFAESRLSRVQRCPQIASS